jgi:hypothetical protein
MYKTKNLLHCSTYQTKYVYVPFGGVPHKQKTKISTKLINSSSCPSVGILVNTQVQTTAKCITSMHCLFNNKFFLNFALHIKEISSNRLYNGGDLSSACGQSVPRDSSGHLRRLENGTSHLVADGRRVPDIFKTGEACAQDKTYMALFSFPTYPPGGIFGVLASSPGFIRDCVADMVGWLVLL